MKVLIAFFCVYLVVTSVNVTYGQKSEMKKLQGKVVDLLGAPIEGAEVEILIAESDAKLKTTTDKSGRYEFYKIPYGNFTITARAKGFRQESYESSVFEGEPKQFDFGLEMGSLSDYPSFEIEGIITKNNLPVENATVAIVNVFNYRIAEKTTTNHDERYKITVTNPGQYVVYAFGTKLTASASAIYLAPTLIPKRNQINLVLKSLE